MDRERTAEALLAQDQRVGLLKNDESWFCTFVFWSVAA
jgi:hypothetical protein